MKTAEEIYEAIGKGYGYNGSKEQCIEVIEKILNESSHPAQGNQSLFKMPTDKQLVDIAILFNDGKLEAEKLADMVGMCQFVLDRLKENNDVTTPSSTESSHPKK